MHARMHKCVQLTITCDILEHIEHDQFNKCHDHLGERERERDREREIERERVCVCV